MTDVTVDFEVRGSSRDAIFDQLRNYRSYEELVEDIESIRYVEETPDHAVTEWSVHFRGGMVEWVETDIFDRSAGEVRFSQVSGDFAIFAGTWTVHESSTGINTINFAAEFDFGIPSMQSLLDPVAARMVIETMSTIVTSLFEDSIATDESIKLSPGQEGGVGTGGRAR